MKIKWIKVLTNLPKLAALIKEGQDVYERAKEHINDPVLKKEFDEFVTALKEFT